MRNRGEVRGRWYWAFGAAILAACSGSTTPADAVEVPVEITSTKFPGRLWDPFLPPLDTGRNLTVDGWLNVPAGSEPVPAVILEHGCGGPSGLQDWAALLAEEGIASLSLDSFTSRNVTEVCSGRETVNVADLIVDVFRAADLVRDHPRIDDDRVAVMGFSFGGRTALWSALRRFQDAYDGDPFAGYVAFYPSTCFIRLEDESDTVGGPLRIFHGTADDYTPIDQCDELVGRLTSAGVDATIHRYEGAHHGFDSKSLAWGVLHVNPSAPSPRGCEFVERDGVIIDRDTGERAGVNSPCVEFGVSSGYDAEARRAAERDLMAFFDQVFD